MQVIDALRKAVRSAATHNPDVQVPPACILWPDGDRQWEPAIPRLQSEMPELLRLGDYAPDQRVGPAIWLRCVIARLVDRVTMPPDSTPILYLPGISRRHLRAVESCPEPLKPLAELQYRGVIWSQVNAKDWTILSFLKSNQGGLGFDVAQDTDTKRAMQLALYRLLDEDAEMLAGRHLDKDFFNTLLSGGDPVRDLLQWLDQGDAFREARDDNAWRGFVEVCKSQLGFDPENDGPLKAAALLAAAKGPWSNVWGRFRDAPLRYSGVPQMIRRTSPPMDLFEDKSGWPQWNDDQEASLRQTLAAAAKLPAHQAREKLLAAEQDHAARRDSVWAELGETPLATAVKSLAEIAQGTGQSLAAGTPKDMAAAYHAGGWKVDAAVLQTLTAVTKPEDVRVVQAVLQTIYLPWIDAAARHLQAQVNTVGYPRSAADEPQPGQPRSGQCMVFVDGLRLDLAMKLAESLTRAGYGVESQPGWAALPSVTATAKPAVAPVRQLIRGQEVNADFEPSVAATGQSLRGGYHLRKLLTDSGWQILEQSKTGDPDGFAWAEIGDIDHEGHHRGGHLPRYLDTILHDIQDRIGRLLAAGWKSVRIVTDHGWLLLPGVLPKTELPAALSENTWGRCAAIKPGASSNETLYPWYWNPDLSFALAPGVSCYRAGTEYTHGGLSLQECVVAALDVTAASHAGKATVDIQDVAWKGMRCKVAVDGDAAGLRLDIRTHAGNPTSGVTMSDRPFKPDGTASVVVDDDTLLGHEATIVIIDADGQLVGQRGTVIGNDEC